MSDRPADFISKTNAMFARVKSQQLDIVREWMISLTVKLLADTPGPGNQMPGDTKYDATGRLRGGWSFSLQPTPTETDRYKGGPYDQSDGGITTASVIADRVREMPMVPFAAIWNDVAYGYIVHESLGRHRDAYRPWVSQVGSNAYGTLDEARERVMSRG